MKRLIQITGLIVVAFIIAVVIAFYPKVSNMKSEYHTAQAIRDIDSYVRENQGQWPSSPEQLQNRYPAGGVVIVDYSITTSELVANPDKVRQAVRPRSGKFYTYPNYDTQIADLILTLREKLPNTQTIDPNGSSR